LPSVAEEKKKQKDMNNWGQSCERNVIEKGARRPNPGNALLPQRHPNKAGREHSNRKIWELRPEKFF